MVRKRAAVLICQADAVLLIHRLRAGRAYYVVPGGGVEPDESVEEAARREIREELSLDVELSPMLWRQENRGNPETYFKAIRYTGQVALGSPELEKHASADQYHPAWIRFTDLAKINLLPETAKQKIIELRRANLL